MASQDRQLRLYRHSLSGHSHRAELLLALLKVPVELVDVDLPAGEHKAAAFLARNPLGQVPVLDGEDGPISDSNAILVYLALKHDPSGLWYPTEPLAAAQVQRWLSVAAGQLVSGPAAARLVSVFKAPLDQDRAQRVAAQLFALLDAHLAAAPYLVGDGPTIADVALYTYTAHAPEGGVALGPYPNLEVWLRRIEALPGFVPMRRALGVNAA